GTPRGFIQNLMQTHFKRGPTIGIYARTGPCLQHVLWRYCIGVPSVPPLDERPILVFGNPAQDHFELAPVDARRQWQPPVAFPEKNDEIRLDPRALAALNLAEADLHRFLVAHSLVAQAPAEIDRLEPCPV